MTRVCRLSCSASPAPGMSVIWDRRNREKGIAPPLQSARLPSKGMQSPSPYHPAPSPGFRERAPALPTECEKQLSPGWPPGHRPSGQWECLLFWGCPSAQSNAGNRRVKFIEAVRSYAQMRSINNFSSFEFIKFTDVDQASHISSLSTRIRHHLDGNGYDPIRFI